jgi:hypothetical protein
MAVLTVDVARELARKKMESIAASAGIECVLIDRVAETKRGWIFFYNSKQFIETGNISFALGGNGPLFVCRDGTIRRLGTPLPWQEEFPEICPQCWSAVDAVLAQRVLDGDRLTWSKSVTCAACGASTEEDGYGVPPAGIKELFLEKDGVWHVLVCKPSDKVSAVAMLRKLFELDIKTAGVLLRSSSMELWLGTQGECVWLSKRLQRVGVETAVEQLRKTIDTRHSQSASTPADVADG